MFPPGVAQQNIVIEILEDSVPEPDEMFDVILASPKNGLIVGFPGKGEHLSPLPILSVTVIET